MQSASHREFLTQAALTYEEALAGSPAQEYLEARGISLQAASTSRLGFVAHDSTVPGFDLYRGMLCIPYWSAHGGVVAVKFRTVDSRPGPRYLWPPGQKSHLYNVTACISGKPQIIICEGELDTVVASSVCGLNAIGIAGVSHWKPHHPRVVRGFRDVYVVTDMDDKEDGSNPGQELARKILTDIPHARNITLPRGMDISDYVLANGPESLPSLLGVEVAA
jgi:DNA primase